MYSDVLSLYPQYISILSPEEFFMSTELPIQETVVNHCTVDLYERDLLTQVATLKTQVRGYSSMCANVSEQVQNKAKFIAEKVNFLEKCETEMQGILEGFDE